MDLKRNLKLEEICNYTRNKVSNSMPTEVYTFPHHTRISAMERETTGMSSADYINVDILVTIVYSHFVSVSNIETENNFRGTFLHYIL